MNSIYQRLIRILSCFLVIAAVLICCVLPANAASWTTLLLSDHIENIYYEGNFRCARYSFGKTPFIKLLAGGSTNTGNGSLTVNTGEYEQFNFSVYPLGVSCTGGPPLSNSNSGSIAIDVSDLRPDASMTVHSSLFMELDLTVWTFDVNISEYYNLSAIYSFAGYNASGGYLGTVESSGQTFNGHIQDIVESDHQLLELPISVHLSLAGFKEPVAYIVPMCTVVLKLTDNNPDIRITSVSMRSDDFSITTRTDMLLKESITMEKIEDQLSDLNDKTDILINGTDEMQDAADNAADQQGELNNQLSDSISELEDLEDISDQFAGDQYTDFFGSIDNISGFLAKAPWTQITYLMAPVMEFSPLTTILIMLVAFIAISILFFGR